MKRIALSVLILIATISGLFALNPSRTYKQLPSKYNMDYTESKVRTDDGATLNVWYFPGSSATDKVVILCHSGEGNMADYLRRVDQFKQLGFNVVAFDYRGFGESSEFEIDNNMYIYPHFQDDMTTILSHVRKNYGTSITLYGWGIGAGLALGIGYTDPAIQFIIADSPFLSMEELEETFSSWDEPMEVPFAGYEKRFEPATTLSNPANKNLKGILLITADDDLFVTTAQLDQLRRSSISKKIISLHNVGSTVGKDHFRFDKESYFSAISSFLKS